MSPLQVRLITAGVIITNFLVAVEATVVSTAAPTIVADLGNLALYSWLFTAYMITVTVTGPVWGKLSDLYGRKLMYLLSVGLFLAGSTLCGHSQSMAELIAFRALQGLGGGALLPLGQTVMAETYNLKDRAKVQGLVTTIFGIASILGPLVGGFISQHLSWRWIFYLNLPFGIIGVLLLAFTLPPHTAKGPVRFDLAGTVVFSLALTTLLLWCNNLPHWPLGDVRAWGGFLVITILSLTFVWLEARHPDPLLPPALFALPMVRAGAVLMVLIGMSLFGVITYLPLFYQGVLGKTASQAGQALSPLLVTWVFGATVSTRLILKAGYRLTVGIGLLGFLSAYVILVGVQADSPNWLLLCAAVLAGIGGGFTVAPLVVAVQSVVDKPHLGIATSEINFFRSVGSTIGVTLMGLVMMATVGPLSSGQMLTNPRLGLGLHHAFQCGLAFCVLSLAAWWMIPAGSAESLQRKDP